jgi:hypothetical protein
MGLFSRLFKQKPLPVIEPYMLELQSPTQYFSNKYTAIIEFDISPDYMSRVLWLDDNLNGAVNVEVLHSYCGPSTDNKWCVAKVVSPAVLPLGVYKERVYVCFEDANDALIFKIKFL